MFEFAGPDFLKFPAAAGPDVSESRRRFGREIEAQVARAVQTGAMHRSSAGDYLQRFGGGGGVGGGDACYDPTSVSAPQHPGYAQPLADYSASAPTYGSYGLAFMPRTSTAAAAVYDDPRKFDCYSKPNLSCSSGISAHGRITSPARLIVSVNAETVKKPLKQKHQGEDKGVLYACIALKMHTADAAALFTSQTYSPFRP